MSKPDQQDQPGHQHCGHNHAHDGHEHAGHEHASGDHATAAHAGENHAGHGHDDHDHSAHGHVGRGHSGHDHAGHDHGHAGHSHAHGHGHHHHGDPLKQGRAFAVAIALNSIFVVIEFAYGFIANSTALMADAGHNLSDVMGLALAWGAAILSKRRPSGRYTYGLRSTSMLAALFNAMLLMVACGAIVWEAGQQLFAPQQVAGLTVSVVAAVGIAVNGVSAWMLLAGSKDDLNVRGAYLHMAADAAVSLGVLVSGLVVMYTGWSWLDPAVSIAIVIVIVLGTWSLLRESLRMMLAAVPDNVDAPKVEQFLRGGAGVSDVHDLHIWAMSTTETALTAHLVMPNGYPGDKAIDDIRTRLREDYSIQHSTLQVEQGTTAHACCLEATAKEASAG